MSPDGIFVTALTILLLIALVSGKVSFDVIGIGLIGILVASGILTLDSAIHGFGNHAVITIAALYVVGEGLTRTGAVEFLARGVLAFGRGREELLVLAICIVSAFCSAFLNNTAVVVVFIPVLIDLSAKTGIPASRMMIPMAYASLLGGTCTLVGTSTNLLVDGVAQQEGQPAMTMFEMSPVGLPFALVGIVFMALFGRYLLPNRASLSTQLAKTAPREYVTELVIGPQLTAFGNEGGGRVRQGRRTQDAFPGPGRRRDLAPVYRRHFARG